MVTNLISRGGEVFFDFSLFSCVHLELLIELLDGEFKICQRRERNC